ncbi:hypothetical protein BH09VER1_BH09VER1_19660 [soil metagenome]
MKTIAISASFTVEVIQSSLIYLLDKIGYEAELKFAAYNQVFQELLNPGSLLRTNQEGVNVLLIRFEDWLHYQKDHPGFSQARELLEKNASDLIDGIAGIPHQVPYLVCIAAPSPTVRHSPADLQLHQEFEGVFSARLGDVKNVFLIKPAEIDALYPVADYYDAQTDKAGHIPYREEYFSALGATIARKIFAITSKQFKVIATDCDETLWRGISGEVGAHVTVDESAKFLQGFLAGKKDEGMVLCLCSKNELSTVEEVFAHNRDMVLSWDDVATHRVNWEPKHANIHSLAQELNLGLDSFVFLDDSPAECNEVQLHCPEVFSICLPKDTFTIPQFFQHLWAFDRARVTAEDKERNSFYKENAKREQQHSQASSLGEYIASLQLKIEIENPGELMIARLAQLSQRTNQFNSTAQRYTEADLVGLLNDKTAFCRYTNVSDRFGDYGIVGLVTGRFSDDKLTVHAFLMSCRAMSRGVEFRMVQDMGKCAQARGAKWVEIEFIPTARNKPIADFLESMPVERKFDEEGKTHYLLTVEKAAGLEFKTDVAPAGSEEGKAGQSPKEEKKKSKVPPDAQKVRAALLEIAGELNTPRKILQRVKQHNRRAGASDRKYVAPANPVEAKVCRLFSDILNLDQVSVEESFFDLGGFSLAAALLSSKISRVFPVECDLDVIPRLKTPRNLAAYISENCDVSKIDLTAGEPDPEQRFVEGTCAVGGGEIHYAQIGHGPVVVLLHGLFGRKEHCYEMAAYLAPSYQVIIPDLPGFGGSTNFPASAYRFDQVIELLGAFFDHLGLEKFHVAGNSMGASLAGIYAAKFPQKALSLAFLGPPSITCPKVSEVEKLAREGVNISVPKTLEEFHQKIDFLFRVKPRVLQDRLDDIGREEIACYDAHLAVYDIVQKDEFLLDTYLDQITSPTLIIWGQDDRFKDVSGAHDAAKKLPQSELHVLPEAGHALFQEYPERISELYKDFLGRIS